MNKYAKGDQLVYGMHGVCSIVEIEKRTVDRKTVEYYVLEPNEQPGTRFYVPLHNEAAVAKLRPVLSANELNTLLRSQEADKDLWIADENQRKQCYRELIVSGDRHALISMVRTLHKHKQAQLAAGRKFHLCDETFLRDAEKLLNSEFSVILNIAQNQVGDYVQSILEKEKN